MLRQYKMSCNFLVSCLDCEGREAVRFPLAWLLVLIRGSRCSQSGPSHINVALPPSGWPTSTCTDRQTTLTHLHSYVERQGHFSQWRLIKLFKVVIYHRSGHKWSVPSSGTQVQSHPTAAHKCCCFFTYK